MGRTPLGQAPVPNVDTRSARHVVGEGALRGRSPRTREGRIGPTALNCSGQWSEAALPVLDRWWGNRSWPGCSQRYMKVCPHFGMQPWLVRDLDSVIFIYIIALVVEREPTVLQPYVVSPANERSVLLKDEHLLYSGSCQLTSSVYWIEAEQSCAPLAGGQGREIQHGAQSHRPEHARP